MADWDNLCAICHEKVYARNEDSSFLPCQHTFHCECLRTWWTKIGYCSCPYCNSNYNNWKIPLIECLDNYLIKSMMRGVKFSTNIHEIKDTFKDMIESGKLIFPNGVGEEWWNCDFRILLGIVRTRTIKLDEFANLVQSRLDNIASRGYCCSGGEYYTYRSY